MTGVIVNKRGGVTHPLLRYHGAKWRIAPWIISHFPQHRIYVEPFGGSGSVLLRKHRSEVEVYNDLDGEIVNLFRVARDHGQDYRHEFTEADHIELANILHEADGHVVVSGYHSDLYDELYQGWTVREKEAQTAGNTKRTEVIWIKGFEHGLFDSV